MTKIQNIDSWENFIDAEAVRKALIWLDTRGGRIAPTRDKIFRAFELTPAYKVKVVIIGQDPYPGVDSAGIPHAHGLAFSSQTEGPPPASLRNIFKELHLEYPEVPPRTKCDLTDWAEQGVLLLNASLTTQHGTPGAHAKYDVWTPMIKGVLESLSRRMEGLVFILWGNDALQVHPWIKQKTKHFILDAAHPSPQSANRGFFGCNHFLKTNVWLLERGKVDIDWLP